MRIEDHPLVIPVLRFDPPTVPTERPLPDGAGDGVIGSGIGVLPLRPLIGACGDQIAWQGGPIGDVTFEANLDASDLARLIAKIGWSSCSIALTLPGGAVTASRVSVTTRPSQP
ncbi:MAG: hypothetical protein ACRCYX_10140 [Dermatophilaceae bacterium]